MMPRKPHPQSRLKTLPDEDQVALYDFLLTHTLAEGVDWVFSNNGVRTNDSSLSEWRGWYEMRKEIQTWNSDVEDLKEMLSTQTSIDPNLIPKLCEAVFINKSARQGDAKTFAAVAGIVQRHKELEAREKEHADKMALESHKLKRKDRTLDQAERKIVQYERKIAALEAQADAAKKAAERAKEAVSAGTMDEATRDKIWAEMDRLILGKSPTKAKA